MSHSLDHIMKPSSVAVIGASTKPHTIGSDLMKRVIEFSFKGRIYPVNPKGGMIEGLQAYPSVLDIEGPVDMAVIVVNSKFVLSTIDQCILNLMVRLFLRTCSRNDYNVISTLEMFFR